MDVFFRTPEIITIITIILWITGIIAGFGKILFWTALVASKHYRINRFIDFLSTRAGLSLLLHPVGISDILIALMLVVLFQQHGIDSPVWLEFAVLSIALYSWHAIWYFLSRPLPQLPRWEFKSILLLFGSIILSLCTIILPQLFISIPSVIQIAIFQILIPLYGWLILAVFTPFLNIRDRSRTLQAHKRIKDFAPAVIAVAGSYGKSSTIAYLKHMLEGSFSVAITPGHGPSDEEITSFALEALQPEDQVLIVELQATSIGDIARACSIAPPIMSIITEIDSRQDSQFHPHAFSDVITEAITTLPLNGLVIVNRDDTQLLEVARLSQVRTKFFSMNDIGHVYATELMVQRDSISFILHIGTEKRLVNAPLFGKQVVYSILAAATAASHLGVSIDTIVKKLEAVPPLSRGLEAQYGVNHALIINNTTARSLAELEAGVDYLSIYTDKQKVVLLSTAILDVDSSVESLLAIADFCIIMDAGRKPAEYIRRLTDRGFPAESISIGENTQAVIALLRQSANPNDVILLQGSVPKKIQDALFER